MRATRAKFARFFFCLRSSRVRVSVILNTNSTRPARREFREVCTRRAKHVLLFGRSSPHCVFRAHSLGREKCVRMRSAHIQNMSYNIACAAECADTTRALLICACARSAFALACTGHFSAFYCVCAVCVTHTARIRATTRAFECLCCTRTSNAHNRDRRNVCV